MDTPIYDRLLKYLSAHRTPFAMPGHKNMRGIKHEQLSLDVTELDATLDLIHESEDVRRANRLLADMYGARESFILTGGSTLGVQTMIASALMPGDTLLASADCHRSVINTCAVCGFKLRLIPVEFDDASGIPRGIDGFELTDDVKAVLLTSPNYYGVTKDIAAAASKCHAARIPLLVDEAHGAHFPASELFPETAVRLGADMVCQSAHKTLSALTGAAYLHISGEVDIKRVRRVMKSFCTSSPPYPIAASADIARAELENADYSGLIELCKNFSARLMEATGIETVSNDDMTRIVLNFSGYKTTGFYVNNILSRNYGIDCEMADLHNIVLITTPHNTQEDFIKLFDALVDITQKLGHSEKKRIISAPKPCAGTVLPLLYVNTESIELSAAAGRISAAAVAAYPPGTALLLPGERITEESIEYIKMLIAAGAEPEGIYEGKVEVIK